MKIIKLNNNLEVAPDISIIIVFETFPNKNIELLLKSTNRLMVNYEIILVTHNIEKGVNVEQYLTEQLSCTSKLVTIRIIVMDLDMDKGPASRRNLGALLSNSANLLFADDDAMILDDLTPLLQYLRDGVCQGVQPLMLRLANTEIVDSAGDFARKNIHRAFYTAYSRGAGTRISELLGDLYVEQVPSMRSAFMIVNKEAFLSVGGFDGTFNFLYEDVDLGWRMVVAGYKLLFVPSVRALHKGGKTTVKSKQYEKVYRLGLLNLHGMHLKVFEYYHWPYIIARFLKYQLLFELWFWRVNRAEEGLLDPVRNVIVMDRQFIERIKAALMHRRILSDKFHFAGRKELQEMTQGKRFIYNRE